MTYFNYKGIDRSEYTPLAESALLSEDSSAVIYDDVEDDYESILIEYHNVSHQIFINYANACYSLLAEGYTVEKDLDIFLEEDESFLQKIKNGVTNVWSRLASVFSNVVSRVRLAMFGKLKPHIEEIREAIKENNMSYNKGVSKIGFYKKWYDLRLLDKIAKIFAEVCNKTKAKVKSLSSGATMNYMTHGGNIFKKKDIRNLDNTNDISAADIAKQFVQGEFEKASKSEGVMEFSTKSNSYNTNGFVNKKGEIGVTNISSTALKNEMEVERTFVEAVEIILAHADKAMNLLQSSVVSLRNDVISAISNLTLKPEKNSVVISGAYPRTNDLYEGSTKLNKVKFDVAQINSFGHAVIGIAENIMHSIVGAIRNNILLMKSCIGRNQAPDKLTEKYKKVGTAGKMVGTIATTALNVIPMLV